MPLPRPMNLPLKPPLMCIMGMGGAAGRSSIFSTMASQHRRLASCHKYGGSLEQIRAYITTNTNHFVYKYNYHVLTNTFLLLAMPAVTITSSELGGPMVMVYE